ncbi:DUF4260 domain-containing protein [Rhodoplanes roseus]|uniref:DUF4260 domain-containing protein n=1 Tax=Rhodoplanes roseus TaxID=29409 RepID=A0A327KZV2_9BRAD|nr:DUF4260 domain-containing protein [Rhodoplanes roseus]RAI43133.1 hypothetical protein CH341_15840 [Rhodoplanes roseus]
MTLSSPGPRSDAVTSATPVPLGAVSGAPLALLRLEGIAVFAAALVAYHMLGAAWWLFGVLILAPDLSMLGYMAGPRAGALAYNLAHTYAAAALLGLAGVLLGSPAVLAVATIWTAHIGLDRALGYGLKYPTGFPDTHLGRLGRSGPA